MKLVMLTAAALAALTACSPAAANGVTRPSAGPASELVAKLGQYGCEPVRVREPEIPDMAGCLVREGSDGRPATAVVVTREQVAMWSGTAEREAAARVGMVVVRGNGWAMLTTRNMPDVAELADALDR